MYYNELPEKITVNGRSGELCTPRGCYYYFFWGHHGECVRLMRSRLQPLHEVISILGISGLNVEGIHSNSGFPEFRHKQDMLRFLNYAYKMGAIETGDQDDFERRRLGLVKKNEST